MVEFCYDEFFHEEADKIHDFHFKVLPTFEFRTLPSKYCVSSGTEKHEVLLKNFLKSLHI